MVQRSVQRQRRVCAIRVWYREGLSFCKKNVKDISVLKALIGLRRKSTNYYRTQLQQILDGNPLNGETDYVDTPRGLLPCHRDYPTRDFKLVLLSCHFFTWESKSPQEPGTALVPHYRHVLCPILPSSRHREFSYMRCRPSLRCEYKEKERSCTGRSCSKAARHQENLKILFYTFLHFFVKKLKKYEKDKSFTATTSKKKYHQVAHLSFLK